MQHSSEMILFIIFYFILRVDCHLAVSCGKWEPICCCQIPLMSYVTPLSNGQISFLTRWQFYPFILDFLPFCMKLGMVDTSRNRFLSLPKTLNVLDNKSISEIFSCTMYVIMKIMEITYLYDNDFKTFIRWKFCSALKLNSMLGVDWSQMHLCWRLKLWVSKIQIGEQL